MVGPLSNLDLSASHNVILLKPNSRIALNSFPQKKCHHNFHWSEDSEQKVDPLSNLDLSDYQQNSLEFFSQKNVKNVIIIFTGLRILKVDLLSNLDL